MPKITRSDAVKIADKLRSRYKTGGKHTLAIVYYNEIKILQFGIRHDRTAGHDYIPNQIFMSKSDTIKFGKCDISYEDWVQRMQERGIISPEPEPPPGPPSGQEGASQKRHG